ncbi:protein kinase domain-containing protein [Allorhizobium terrae]|nr:protein kinase [Allorhizobium terrae]
MMVHEEGDELTARFAALMACVRHQNGDMRPLVQQKILIDQLRNALDRAASGMEPMVDSGEPGFIAGTFAVENRLYRGAHFDVLKLRHRDLASLHVLKTLRQDQPIAPSRAALLRREAEIGLCFRDPHLVETTALLRLADGRPAILQPWRGEPLSSRLTELSADRPLDVSSITVMLSELLLALHRLHQHGYVHCDVKPSNIFLSPGAAPHLSLGDFGIALKMGETHAALELKAAYSQEYCAPEQAPDRPAHPTMDIYSAGRVLQHLLMAANQPIADELTQFANELCAQNPADRPQSAEIALAELKRIVVC